MEQSTTKNGRRRYPRLCQQRFQPAAATQKSKCSYCVSAGVGAAEAEKHQRLDLNDTYTTVEEDVDDETSFATCNDDSESSSESEDNLEEPSSSSSDESDNDGTATSTRISSGDEGSSSDDDCNSLGNKSYEQFNVVAFVSTNETINDDKTVSSDIDSECSYCLIAPTNLHQQFVEQENGLEIIVNWLSIDGGEQVRLSSATIQL